MNVSEIRKMWKSGRVAEPVMLTILWLLLFASPIFLSDSDLGIKWTRVFRVWQSFLPFLIIFLLNRFVLLPYIFFRHKRWLFLVLNFVVIVLFSFMVEPVIQMRKGNIQATEMHEPRGGPPENFNKKGPERPAPMFDQGQRLRQRKAGHPHRRGMPPYINFILISVLMVGFQTGIALSFRFIDSERKRISTEKENVSTKLAFLRNQVSPHFFMNTLNNIHSLVDFDREKAKDAIIQLSKLMRHMLYDVEISRIPLEKELNFVKNYVNLMQLRYDDNVEIELRLPEVKKEYSIPPLLFTSFIENAFKYGISSVEPSFVRIVFSIDDQKLNFRASNSLFEKNRALESTGIGIENARKRLDLIYGKDYTLEIDNIGNSFDVELAIPL